MRLIAHASVLAIVMMSAAPTASAEDDDYIGEVRLQGLANEAGVNTEDLRGAVVTTKMDPAAYLYSTGELEPPPPPKPVAVASSAPAASVWTRLASCESGGNWRANTGNGYYGGLQEDMTFWRRHGGTTYASRPDLASASAQISVAIAGQAVQGWGAWPACSRRLGLR